MGGSGAAHGAAGEGQEGEGEGEGDARLEDGVLDLAVLPNLELQLHHVAAGRRANKTRADVQILLVEGSDVARRLVVVDDVLVVAAPRDGEAERGRRRAQRARQHGSEGATSRQEALSYSPKL